MSDRRQIIAEYIIHERETAVCISDILDDTELESYQAVQDTLEKMYEEGLLTSDFYRTEDGKHFARYYSTVELENKYY